MNVSVIKPYGFCVGVEKVINTINDIIDKHKDMPIFCLGQIVHNQTVVDDLKEKGITFLQGNKEKIIDNISEGVVVFSAHGTNENIVKKAIEKGLIVYDLVCWFVEKELKLIKEKINDGYDIIYIGIKNHEEAIAACSISNKIHLITNIEDVNSLTISNTKIAAINQTTLSIIELVNIFDHIKNKYPQVEIVDEICGSTRIRQSELLKLNKDVDGVLVIGNENSNNTKSLYQIAKQKGHDVMMIALANQIDYQWLKSKKNVVLVSGASTPKKNVDEILKKIKNL